MSRGGDEADPTTHGQRRARKVFTSEEDAKLTEIMRAQKFTSWEKVAQDLPDRTARQCRDRWLNYLSPNIRKDPWLWSEDKLLVAKINEMGTHWSNIAKYFVGRSDNHIKNRWYSYLKSRVRFDAAGKYILIAQDEDQHDGNTEADKAVVSVAPLVGPGEDFWDMRLLGKRDREQQPIFSSCGELVDVAMDVFSIL